MYEGDIRSTLARRPILGTNFLPYMYNPYYCLHILTSWLTTGQMICKAGKEFDRRSFSTAADMQSGCDFVARSPEDDREAMPPVQPVPRPNTIFGRRSISKSQKLLTERDRYCAKLYLHYEAQANKDMIIRLNRDQLLSIGRHKSNDLQLEQAVVSSVHVRVHIVSSVEIADDHFMSDKSDSY